MKPHTSLLAAAALSVAAFGAGTVHAAPVEVLNEGFADVAGLAGWTQVNQSVPAGTSWFQGNDSVFPAQTGAANAYAAANFLGASNGSGSVDNWLITPTLDLSGTTTLSFFTRHATEPGFSDLLEVRFSYGSGTDTAGFSTLLTTVGGGAAYPDDWQRFTATFDATGSGRFAFRYVGTADALNYVGLDTVNVVSAVPEPSSWATMVLGLGLVGLLRRRSRRAPHTGSRFQARARLLADTRDQSVQ
jgi:hypothetical protein